MSYTTLIQRNVSSAFKSLGSLAETVEFVKKSSRSFDMSTQNISQVTEYISAPVVVVSVSNKNGRIHKRLIIDASFLPLLDLTVKFEMSDGKIYQAILPFISNGFTATVEAEAAND